MIATHEPLQAIDSRDLPGPDTRTKAEAATSDDVRLRRMLLVSADVGWPIAWTDDLYRHDKQTLVENPDGSFVWILRDTGTHLYPCRCFNWHVADSRRRTVHWWSGDHKLNVIDDPKERARYFVVSRGEIRSVSWQEAQHCFIYPE